MSGDNDKKRKMHNIKRLSLLLAVLAILALIAVVLIFGIGSCYPGLSGCFSSSLPAITVDEFNFDVGRSRVFINIEGSVAAAGTLGIQVLDAGGSETLRDPFRMGRPAIKGSAGRCIAFDIGGFTVRVFDSSQVNASIETDGRIVSASINQNGWFCVVTQESGGIRGVVTVYNNLGEDVYRVALGGGYALSADLSHDNKDLAILNLTDNGSRISFYRGIDVNVESDFLFDLPDELIIDIWHKPNGDLLAISTGSLYLIDRAGNSSILYTFSEKRLGGYTSGNDFIAFHLYDYGIGHRGRLVTILPDGRPLGEVVLDRDVISMSAVDKSLVVLQSDSITFLNEKLEELSVSGDTLSVAGASRILAVREGTALATSDNSAVVIRGEGEH